MALEDIPFVSLASLFSIPVVIGVVLIWKLYYANRCIHHRLAKVLKKNGFDDLNMHAHIVGTQTLDPFGWVQTILIGIPNPLRRPMTRRQLLPLIGPDLRAEESRLVMDWRIEGVSLQIGANNDFLEILFQIPFSPRDLYLRRDYRKMLRVLDFARDTAKILRRFTPITPIPPSQPAVLSGARTDYAPER